MIEKSRPRWLIWTLSIVSLLLIACVVYGIILYQSIEKSKVKGFSEIKAKTLEETELSEIYSMTRFQGEETCHIIFGKTEEENKIVFVPADDKENIIIDQSEIMPKEEIQKEWHMNCNQCDLVKIVPAMVGNEPLWELTYIDDDSKYTFEYLSIYDGAQYEILKFKQMFK